MPFQPSADTIMISHYMMQPAILMASNGLRHRRPIAVSVPAEYVSAQKPNNINVKVLFY